MKLKRRRPCLRLQSSRRSWYAVGKKEWSMPNQASERLLRNSKKIMKYWEERTRKEVTAACHQETLALQDALPEFIQLLATALSTTLNRTDARIRADRLENERVGRK